MSTTHCSLHYHHVPVTELPVFVEGVRQNIKNNATTFPAPPIADAALEKLITDERTAYATYKQGGLAQKPAYTLAKAALLAGLDTTAHYVDSVAKGDSNIIVLAGFVPTVQADGANKTRPIQAQNVTVKRGVPTGELDMECESYGAAHEYGVVISEGQPLPADVVLSNDGVLTIPKNVATTIKVMVSKERKKTVTGLTAGVTYFIYYFVTNTAGVSPLSVAVSIMAA